MLNLSKLFYSIFKMIKNLSRETKFIFHFYRVLTLMLTRLNRIKDVALMYLMFTFAPSYTYLFSTRKILPSKKNKYKIINNFTPYQIIKKKTKFKKLGTVNLICRGSSFNLNKIKKMKGKIFILSGWEPLRIDSQKNIYNYDYFSHNSGNIHDTSNAVLPIKSIFFNNKNIENKKAIELYRKFKIYRKKNLIYVCNRKNVLEKYLNNKLNFHFTSQPVYSKNERNKVSPQSSYWESNAFKNLFKNKKFMSIALLENFHEFREKKTNMGPPTGSVLPFIYALSQYAKQVNIYGWDFYLDKPANKMNYFQLLWSLYKYEADVNRSKSHFESAIYNVYFAHELSKLPNIKMYGYLGEITRHKNLINKIKKVFFLN